MDKLIEVVERLIVDVSANRLMIGVLAAASPDGLRALNAVTQFVDEATLPMAVTDAEREAIKETVAHVVAHAEKMRAALFDPDA